MKKIYIFTAVLALLSLSLNAQMLPQFKSKTITGKTEESTSSQNDRMFRAPARYALQDGEYFLGPYNTDDYGTTGYTLFVFNTDIYSSQVDISSVLDRSEFESYIGDEIIGFRFATRSSVGIYGFVVSTEGPNHWVDDIYQFNLSNSGYETVSGEGWHEYTLNEPVQFQVADSVASLWIGYSYRAPYGSSNSNKTILVNPNSTGHDTYAYDHYDGSFYDVTDFLGGDLAVQLIMRSNNKTPKPVITSQVVGDNVVITATGNGTVTLNIPGYPEVTGTGSASITVPRHMQDYTVTATATAQEPDLPVSDPTTQQVTIPGMSNDGWIEMTETYDNPTDLLSFKVKVGNDTTDIMMIDQFLESTVFNDHPSSYTYILKETKVINGVDSTMTSNPADIPVYKTNSTMRGLYTEAQVLADDYADEANRLTANAVNGEIDYDVVPDNNVLYYSLYRGGIQEETPVVDVDHRISQLQKFEDNTGDHVQYYFTENHLTGILPRYDYNDNIGSQTVERLDVNYVTGETGNQMSYVPVIWTFGLYTARGDGKNNSYGSDIKYNELGGVNVSSDIIVNWSDNNKMKVNGVDYYVVSPVITLNAVSPELVKANDEDAYQYVPYMYRVWCTYTDAHNFGHLLNPDGINYSLVETGLIDAPFCIGEVKADTLSNPSHVVIGRDLGHVSPQTQWSFAVTKEAVTNGDIKFVVRYYYKKVVTDADPTAQPSGLRGNRDGGNDYAIYEKSTSSSNIVTGVNELWSGYGKVVISQTYVNAQGMQSDKPFDGLNIVVTRFSDGTTTTTKVVR